MLIQLYIINFGYFSALYGALFSSESEAAFSNYRMWESFGFIIAFAYSNYVCTSVKLLVLKVVMGVGMGGYFCVEWLQWRERRIDESSIVTLTRQAS